MQRHEVWRHAYLSKPYLVGASDEILKERFKSIFMNCVELTKEGKIAPVSLESTDEFMVAFTHLDEEYGARQGELPVDVVAEARLPISKYFEEGVPPGVRMFGNYRTPDGPLLVKYGRRQFLEPMLNAGSMRIANAEHYSNPGFLDSIRDDETTRNYFIPTYMARLQGRRSISIEGRELSFGDDDLILPLEVDDYYLLSLCTHIHHRMPTDFDADAALVINRPVHFVQRVVSAFLAQYPEWDALEGPVIYYDPYQDYKKFKVPEMAKHIGYAYQKEFRIAFRPKRRVSTSLEPVMLSIGRMTEYADLVAL
ncbi:MAG: hypothetical protein JSS56_03815 [Proteobacteria bacterium]|nr:hypothetical protein [Pseudomonadota bacterium]